MLISLIVAVSENNVIGKDNALPWHLPADIKFFRDTTMGHCVIMGRRNYDSIPVKYRPLDGRTNIVITRKKDFSAPGCIVANSVDEALLKAERSLVPNSQIPTPNSDEVFIIGGADIYQQTINIADKLYYTKIHHSFDGDAFFPEVDLKRWKLVSKTDVQPDAKNKFPFSICVYEKK